MTTNEELELETPNYLEKDKKRGQRISKAKLIKKHVEKNKVKGTITERKRISDNKRYVGILSKTKTTTNNKTKPQLHDVKKEVIIDQIQKEEMEEAQAEGIA